MQQHYTPDPTRSNQQMQSRNRTHTRALSKSDVIQSFYRDTQHNLCDKCCVHNVFKTERKKQKP